jgi:hypothetical protein
MRLPQELSANQIRLADAAPPGALQIRSANQIRLADAAPPGGAAPAGGAAGGVTKQVVVFLI